MSLFPRIIYVHFISLTNIQTSKLIHRYLFESINIVTRVVNWLMSRMFDSTNFRDDNNYLFIISQTIQSVIQTFNNLKETTYLHSPSKSPIQKPKAKERPSLINYCPSSTRSETNNLSEKSDIKQRNCFMCSFRSDNSGSNLTFIYEQQSLSYPCIENLRLLQLACVMTKNSTSEWRLSESVIFSRFSRLGSGITSCLAA